MANPVFVVVVFAMAVAMPVLFFSHFQETLTTMSQALWNQVRLLLSCVTPTLVSDKGRNP
jgi:hypothetical protein